MTRIKRKEFKQTFPYTRDELWLKTADYIQDLPTQQRRQLCRLILKTYVDSLTMALHRCFDMGILMDLKQIQRIVFDILKRDLRGGSYRFVRPDMMELLLVRLVRDCERESISAILAEMASILNVKLVGHVSPVYKALRSIMDKESPFPERQEILLEQVARFRSNFS